jgi:hypothetical protein
MGLRWLALSVAAAAWLSPTPALAVELQLEQPAPCSSADELAFRVSRALGQPMERVAGPQLAVQVRQDRRGFHARLEIAAAGASSPGLRQLDAASCEELTEALAIAIAIAIGSSAPTPSAPAAHEALTPVSAPAQPEPLLDTPAAPSTSTLPSSPMHAAISSRSRG